MCIMGSLIMVYKCKITTKRKQGQKTKTKLIFPSKFKTIIPAVEELSAAGLCNIDMYVSG